MRSFYILNQRAATPPNSAAGKTRDEVLPRRTGYRERLRYRDMIWAFHSESQELLVGACTAACNGRMTWADARALGLPVWLNSIESLVLLFYPPVDIPMLIICIESSNRGDSEE
jgi:hypothetical protein